MQFPETTRNGNLNRGEHDAPPVNPTFTDTPPTRVGVPAEDKHVQASPTIEKGAAVRLAKQQTGENRYPINSHEANHKTHGPNN
jgi:hypothetical protein